MADFCKQCSIEHLGSDTGDYAGICAEGNFTYARCGGCGDCVVTHDGTCIAEHCTKQHGLGGREGDESARVEQWAANYLDCQSEVESIKPNYDDVQTRNVTPQEDKWLRNAVLRSARKC